MAHESKAHLGMGHRYHGSVCPFSWVFHYVDPTVEVSSESAHRTTPRRLGEAAVTESNEQENIRFSVRILQGGLYRVSARLDNPPGFTSPNKVNLNLMAGPDPYSTVALGHEVQYDITLCSVQGHRTYLGVFGDESGCALYDVSAVYLKETEECREGALRVTEALVSSDAQ